LHYMKVLAPLDCPIRNMLAVKVIPDPANCQMVADKQPNSPLGKCSVSSI